MPDDQQMLEIAPGRFKPVSKCTPRDARAAAKVQHQRMVLIERCARLLEDFPTVMRDELPPLFAKTFTIGEIPENTSLPELKDAWRDLARLHQQRSA